MEQLFLFLSVNHLILAMCWGSVCYFQISQPIPVVFPLDSLVFKLVNTMLIVIFLQLHVLFVRGQSFSSTHLHAEFTDFTFFFYSFKKFTSLEYLNLFFALIIFLFYTYNLLTHFFVSNDSIF